MSNLTDLTYFESLKFKREALEKEISYRREKMWKIFSWLSSILVAITGGFIALEANGNHQFNPSRLQRWILVLAVLVLMVYACLWLLQNMDLMACARHEMHLYDKELGFEHYKIEEVRKDRPRLVTRMLKFGMDWLFGYIPTIMLLALAAIFTILFS